jgi:predicted SprT family Zn-dependent metalloprotease
MTVEDGRKTRPGAFESGLRSRTKEFTYQEITGRKLQERKLQDTHRTSGRYNCAECTEELRQLFFVRVMGVL